MVVRRFKLNVITSHFDSVKVRGAFLEKSVGYRAFLAEFVAVALAVRLEFVYVLAVKGDESQTMGDEFVI